MKEEQHYDWNPLDASILNDQRHAYDEMRERCPVAQSKFMGWSLFRHKDITDVLADSETFSNVSEFLAIPNGTDPPVHGRYREALDPNFTAEQLIRVEPRAHEIAALLLEPILAAEKAEFIDAFINPYALRTLCAWLGWPEQQWEFFADWVQSSKQAAFSKDASAGKSLANLFSEQVKANLRKRRASPNDMADATNRLLTTDVDGVQLDDDQIVSVLRNWVAGHGTVADGLSVVVMHLAEDVELQDRLRSEPSLIPAAIEEILRVDGPLVANPRTTTRAVEIQGRLIPEGSQLTLMWIAANRDPFAFDEPNITQIERNTKDSLAWGQGIHLCQGASLAQLEMRMAIETLLAQTKRFVLADNHVPSRAAYPCNGPAALVLRFY